MPGPEKDPNQVQAQRQDQDQQGQDQSRIKIELKIRARTKIRGSVTGSAGSWSEQGQDQVQDNSRVSGQNVMVGPASGSG